MRESVLSCLNGKLNCKSNPRVGKERLHTSCLYGRGALVGTTSRESTGHGDAYILLKETCWLSWRAESPGKGITDTFPKTTKEDQDVCKSVKPLF